MRLAARRCPDRNISGMDVIYRKEQSGDYRQSESVVREAFWNRYAPACSEHFLLHEMRSSDAFDGDLSIVACSGGRVVGIVAGVAGRIEADDGRRVAVATLGPIAVAPEYQGRGIGSALIGRFNAAAAGMGFAAVVLCGDPDYYCGRGFTAAERYGVRTVDDMYADALLVCELRDGALQNAAGRYVEDRIYEVDLGAAARFDRDFPAAEALSGTPSQRRFEMLAAMRRKA